MLESSVQLLLLSRRFIRFGELLKFKSPHIQMHVLWLVSREQTYYLHAVRSTSRRQERSNMLQTTSNIRIVRGQMLFQHIHKQDALLLFANSATPSEISTPLPAKKNNGWPRNQENTIWPRDEDYRRA